MEQLGLHASRKLAGRTVRPQDAVMFDIDDTLWRPANGMTIGPMLDLLYTARMLGYTIVIITARPGEEENQRWTVSQLHQMGVVPDHLVFAPPGMKDTVKSATKLNYIMSVGDQWTDLGLSEFWVKLAAPNDGRQGASF